MKSKYVLFSTDIETPNEFAIWEQEELNNYKADIEEKYANQKERSKSKIEDDNDFYIPDYVLKALGISDNDVSLDAVPASKLPSIAVIGRPNTGKSTIVNKLTDSYSVSSFILNSVNENSLHCNQ
jgi:predicted GTPase